MALNPCPECGRDVSEHAQACPNCGYPFKEGPEPNTIATHGGRIVRAWGFEWRTKAEVFGWPLVHVAIGRDPQTLKLRVARGIVAIGQFGVGLVTIAQFGVGLLFAFGQVVGGNIAVGQIAIGVLFGLGQFAIGLTAIGQFALGRHVLAQIGFGKHVWTSGRRDPEAVRHFRALWQNLKALLGR